MSQSVSKQSHDSDSGHYVPESNGVASRLRPDTSDSDSDHESSSSFDQSISVGEGDVASRVQSVDDVVRSQSSAANFPRNLSEASLDDGGHDHDHSHGGSELLAESRSGINRYIHKKSTRTN